MMTRWMPLVVAAAMSIGSGPAHGDEAAAGKELYLRFCASCHGRDGRGDGPVARALGEPPTDLTVLARDNGGEFPELKAVVAIDGTRTVRAHGVSEMPVWGEVLGADAEGAAGERARETVMLIVGHLRRLQRP